MTLYLDCEFNGHGGELISMALVSDIDDSAFYEAVNFTAPVVPWVNQNVIQNLDKDTIPRTYFRALLCMYLHQHQGEDIVADWPYDFTLLLNEMAGPSYDRSFMFPCTMRLIKSGQFTPEKPHNALSDAKALRKWCMENMWKIEEYRV